MNGAELYRHVMALRGADGTWEAEEIVTAARPKSHPLHGEFDWNDKTAGHQHRLTQARGLIRQVLVLDAPLTDDGKPMRIRAIVSTPSPSGRQYRSTEEVAADPLMAAMVLRDFERDWKQFRARWQHLAAFVDVVRRDLEEPTG